jgi:hypothetical protein
MMNVIVAATITVLALVEKGIIRHNTESNLAPITILRSQGIRLVLGLCH